MSMRVVDFTGPGGIGATNGTVGNSPCITGRRPDSIGQVRYISDHVYPDTDKSKSGVRIGETVQLRFAGTPPFNLTQS